MSITLENYVSGLIDGLDYSSLDVTDLTQVISTYVLSAADAMEYGNEKFDLEELESELIEQILNGLRTYQAENPTEISQGVTPLDEPSESAAVEIQKLVKEINEGVAARKEAEAAAQLAEANQKIRVILVGRHASELPEDIEVVAQENILWATDEEECRKQFKDLHTRAREQGVKILLQNVPGVLATALVDEAIWAGNNYASAIRVGVIISVPGPRVAAQVKEYKLLAEDADDVAEAIRFANGRAKVEIESTANIGLVTVRVTVDPVSPFVFSHIVWM